MEPIHNPLDEFSPDLYFATLSEVAHVDGLHPAEQTLLEQQAKLLGVTLDNLPTVPDDLSNLPWATKIMVYRDALVLAFADDIISPEEDEYLAKLSERMQLSKNTAELIHSWVNDYSALLDRFDSLISEQEA